MNNIKNPKLTLNLQYLIFASVYILTFTMPYINQICGVYIRVLLMGIVLVMSIFLRGARLSVPRIIVAFLPLVSLDIFNGLYMGADIIIIILNYVFDITLSLLATKLLYTRNIKLSRIFVHMVLFTLCITAVTTYIVLQRDPDASRVLATIASSDDVYAAQMGAKNVAGYTIIYFMVLIFPMVIGLYKNKIIKPIKFWSIAIVFFLCIINSQYATALLLFSISFLLVFQGKRFNARYVLSAGIILLVIYIIYPTFYSDLFRGLADLVDGGYLSERFNYIAGSFEGDMVESDVDSRRVLFMRSITSFLEHPILGNWLIYSNANGGHSYILDTLSKYGILGIVGLVYMYRTIYRELYIRFKTTPIWGYLIWSFGQTIVLSTINTGQWIFVLTFFIPLAAYVVQNSQEVVEK